MDTPGAYTLIAMDLTTALTAQAQTSVDGLDGIAAVTIEAEFAYGSGGTTCALIVQTSHDGGTIWFDIARFDFLLASRRASCNLTGLLANAVATYAALSAEGVNNGNLGPMLRGVITSTGTYVNTTATLRASVR